MNPFKMPTLPTPPQPVKPPPLPDINSPANLAAQKLAQQNANASGRSATMLTTGAQAGSTLAGSSYSGSKTGG